MTRVIVAACCALAVSGCASSWVPSLDFGGGGGGYLTEVALESEPAGAEARTSFGQACRTPCRLAVDARSDFSITYTHEGYISQSVPVRVRQPGDSRFDPGAVAALQLDPNPVAVVLEPAPPPPKAKRRPVRKRAASRPNPAAPARAMAPAPSPARSPAPPSPAPVAAAPAPPAPRALPTTMSSPPPGATITPVAPAQRTN